MKQKLNCMLLVDDNEDHNFLSQMIIQETGITQQVHTVSDGCEALDYLMHRGRFKENGNTYPMPDVILLDINMPRMNGWDFLEEYQKLDDTQKQATMVIMLTTSDRPEDKNRARHFEEVSDYRNKPLTPKMLDELMQQYFRKKSSDS